LDLPRRAHTRGGGDHDQPASIAPTPAPAGGRRAPPAKDSARRPTREASPGIDRTRGGRVDRNGEAFFSAALQEDPSLIECGVSEKVIAATPTTLIALLRTVAYGWRQEKLAENAEEVAKLGKEIYERVCTLGERWSDLGDRLRKTVEAYNSATSTLETRGIVSARRFRDLKVGTDDSEITDLKQIEVIPRSTQAEELTSGRLPAILPKTEGIAVTPLNGTTAAD
jgi:hypothetical protein